jgi:membrane associated rhomboid family serine protease
MFPPAIKWLLAINIALFLLPLLGGNTVDNWLVQYGALWPIGHPLFRPWQYITYMFLHGGFMHVFFNMLALWMFGIELEQMWGSRRFLAYYFLCGLGAGIIHSLVMMMMGNGAPTVGASGAIFGVTLAFGMAFPNRIVFLGFFLPLPARIATLLFIGLELYAGIAGSTDGVAHFAHLGGALIGFILIKIGGVMTLGGIFDRFPWFRQGNAPMMMPFEQQPVRRQRSPQIIDVPYRDVGQRAPVDRGHPRMDFGADQSRIDEILDKISRSGYQNLTDEEKAILNEASKKMR